MSSIETESFKEDSEGEWWKRCSDLSGIFSVRSEAKSEITWMWTVDKVTKVWLELWIICNIWGKVRIVNQRPWIWGQKAHSWHKMERCRNRSSKKETTKILFFLSIQSRCSGRRWVLFFTVRHLKTGWKSWKIKTLS